MKSKIKTKNHIPLYALYIASLISVTGDAMASIAIPWFVLQTTGSAIQTGITAFFAISPIILGTFFGGTIVDRVGYKRISVMADLASGLTMLMIPLLYSTIGLQFWQLLALVFIGNLMDAPGRSARQSMLPELAEAADTSLDRATGTTQALSRATQMLGAPIAGILIVFIGAIGVLWIDAATFLISAITIQLFIPVVLFKKQAEIQAESENSYFEDLREGFRFVKNDPLILTIIVVVMLTNMIDSAMHGVTYPIYILELYGNAWSLGVVLGVFGASALVGTLFYSWLGEKYSRRWVFIITFMIVGTRFFFMLLYPSLPILIGISILTGLAVGPINPILSVISYERIPDHMRARVFGLLSAGVLVAMPAGALMAGFLLEYVGMTPALMIYGTVYILAISSLIFNPHSAQMDAQQTPVEMSPELEIA